MYRAAPAHVHSAHAAYQLLEHRMHSHNPPTPWAGLARVFFCCVLLHVFRGVILDRVKVDKKKFDSIANGRNFRIS